MIVPFNDLRRDALVDAEGYRAAFDRVLERGWFLTGPEVDAFEHEFAQHSGLGEVVAVANGTDALEIALRALGVGAGDEVVVAANAGGYGSFAARLAGATPVFADVDESTLLVTPDLVAGALTSRTRAVICTHLYGAVVDVPAVRMILGTGIAVVEDCAQAHFARVGDQPVGSLGDLSTFSFYPTKNLGAFGDAGAIGCNRPGLGAAVRELAQYGWRARFHANRPGGRNSRMDELQAAILRERLTRADSMTARRSAVLLAYEQELGEVLRFPNRSPGSVAHLAVALVEDRDNLRDTLEASGIGTAVHYPVPDHQQPALASFAAGPLKVAEWACSRVVSLPLFPGLTDEEIATVCRAVRRWRDGD